MGRWAARLGAGGPGRRPPGEGADCLPPSGPMTRKLRCRSCGNFVPALPKDGELIPVGSGKCHECGGTEFKQTQG